MITIYQNSMEENGELNDRLHCEFTLDEETQ